MKVFADTYFYLALFNTRETHHRRVVEYAGTLTGMVVTTQWVLMELADAMAGVPERREMQAKFQILKDDPGTTVVEASGAWFERGLALYHSRPDKAWSLTDCISFAVMAERGLTEALTGDRHFEQAGFTTLLAEK